MSLDSIVETADTARQLASAVGAGVIAAGATDLVLSVARGLRAGTTVREQLTNGLNLTGSAVVGVLAGFGAYSLGVPADQPVYEILQYTGAAASGAAFGAMAFPIVQAGRDVIGLGQSFQENAGQGALRGAVYTAAGYGALDIMQNLGWIYQ